MTSNGRAVRASEEYGSRRAGSALADDGHVSKHSLSRMGLGGMQVVPDREGIASSRQVDRRHLQCLVRYYDCEYRQPVSLAITTPLAPVSASVEVRSPEVLLSRRPTDSGLRVAAL